MKNKEYYIRLGEAVERLEEKNCPTNPSKWSYYKSQAKKKFDVYPSAYANGWASKQYKDAGGGWKKCASEATDAQETEFHTQLDKLVHKTFGKRPEEMDEKFDKTHLGILQYAFKDIDRINPSEPAYKRLVDMLNKLSKQELQQIAALDIKFLSLLAKNLLSKKESVNEGRKSKDGAGVRYVEAIYNNSVGIVKMVMDEKKDAKEVVDTMGPVLINAIKATLAHNYKPNPQPAYILKRDLQRLGDLSNQQRIDVFKKGLKELLAVVTELVKRPSQMGVKKLEERFRKLWNNEYGANIGLNGEGPHANTIIESVNEASIDVDVYRKKQAFVIGPKFAEVASDSDVELMARLKIVNSEHEWQLKQNIKSMDHLYKKYKLRSKKGIEESVVNESHFQVGDKVKMSHGGVGVVKSLDKEDGADDEKYYNIELPNGEVMKHAPNELTLSVNEGVSRDAAYIHGILQSGQDATQNFIDDNGLDGEKLSDYVKANRNNIDGYNVKHYISGERGTVGSVPKLRQAFIKKFKKGKSVNESSMSNIDIIAQEANDFKDFVKEFYKEYKDFPKDKDTIKWLKGVYDNRSTAESIVNESSVEIGDIVFFPSANSAATVVDRFGRSVTLKLANGKKVKTVVDKIKLLAQDNVNEGNAFTGALFNARKEGLTEFEFNGKKYPVHKLEEEEKEETLAESKLTKDSLKKIIKEEYHNVKTFMEEKYGFTPELGKVYSNLAAKPFLKEEEEEILDEYDVENYQDLKEFVQFMAEYKSDINEAEYQGRKVKLGKIMQGDVKKFKVYVKNDKGNVVKVNFGQGGDAKGGTMRIRKDNPEARKSFRARHNCDTPGPRWKARYWSCRKW
jgi:hypothetical protein